MTDYLNQVSWRPVVNPSAAMPLMVMPGALTLNPRGAARVVVSKSAAVVGAGAIVHTVTAGKIFHLLAFNVGFDGGANKYAQLSVRNSADEVQYNLAILQSSSGGGWSLGQAFPWALPIAAGWDIYLSGDGTYASAFIFGFEE